MKLLLQRVKGAAVSVSGQEIARIGPGLLVLVGFGANDGGHLPDSPVWKTLLKKTLDLRIFPDVDGKLNKSVTEHDAPGAQLLLVSQFTLYADCRKGRRPSFTSAAPPDVAQELFERFVDDAEAAWPGKICSGRFGADMDVSLVNWGPVTISLDSENLTGR